MNRRAFVVALLALCGCGRGDEPKTATPSPASPPSKAPPQAQIPRISILYFGTYGPGGVRSTDVLRQRLAELGYVDGKTILIEERSAGGDTQRMSDIAREVAASKPDVIVTSAIAATVAARQTTGTIPIVMMHAGNPVAAGLIETLARPGGNVTGTMNLSYGGKHVDLMRELLPRVTRLAVLVNPTNANAPLIVTAATEAASKSGIRVVVAEVRRAEDFPNAYAAIRSAHPDGLIVAMEPLLATHNDELIAFAAATRLPAIYDSGEMARRGGLIAYATMFSEHYRMAADYVDKILKGSKPADLPVEQPARFELVINLKTAKTLGLAIPRDLLLRADEVIQ
jgi:ABC-type uncharacterized transport system substrate-binding protein